MQPFLPAKKLRRLGWKWRGTAIFLWFLIFFVLFLALGTVVSEEQRAGLTDSTFGLVAGSILLVLWTVATPFLAIRAGRRSKLLRMAARMPAPLTQWRGRVLDRDEVTYRAVTMYRPITSTQYFIEIAGERPVALRFVALDRRDNATQPGQPVQIQLYGTQGTIVAVVYNEQSGRITPTKVDLAAPELPVPSSRS